MRKRYLWVTGVVVVVLVAGGLFVALRNRDVSKSADVVLPSATATAIAAPAPGVSASAVVAPKVKDVPTPPAGLSAKVAAKGLDSLSAEERAAWQRYLDETAAIVANNSVPLEATVRAAVAAIKDGKAADLQAMFAPDESVALAFAQALARAYPPIASSNVQRSVSIFCVGEATVYFGYSVVAWEDAGIASEHTIAVPLRFKDGTWYLTSIGSGTRGLESVQGVRF